MYEVEATYGKALAVWWALMWRAIPLSMGGSMLVGMIFGVVFGIIGIDVQEVQWFFISIGFLTGLAITVWIIRRLMTKGFGKKYRLAIVEK